MTNTAIVFVDMLRHDWRRNRYGERLDAILSQFSHNYIFTNAFAESPDTPRSMSEFFTGISSEKNGVDSRFKWPRYFLKSELDTLMALLSKDKCRVNLVIDNYRIESGLFSEKDLNEMSTITSWNEFALAGVNRSENIDNCITFFDITDFHTAVDLWHGTHNSWRGLDKVADKLKKIIDIGFDDLIMFSDHGCLLTSDEKTYTNFGNIDNRHRIVFEYHSNSTYGHLVDTDNFINMTDIHNIVKNFSKLGLEERTQSLSFSADKERCLIIKDYSKGINSFAPDIYRIINRNIDLIISHKYIIEMKNEKNLRLLDIMHHCNSDRLNELIKYHTHQKKNYEVMKSNLVSKQNLNILDQIRILVPMMKRKVLDYLRKI